MRSMPTPFSSDKVIDEAISEARLRAYSVGFDQNVFRLGPLLDIVMSVIPEFAFGMFEAQKISHTISVNKLREAAKTIYTSEKYQKRGELGEIILHLLLRDFHGTIPLVSKIYFKDTDNAAVHGFDGIHITVEDSIKKLWLGESKLYSDGKKGVHALAEDVSAHFTADYLRREFALISRKIHQDTPELERWKNLLHEHTRLDEIFDSICVPLVCTYSSDIYASHSKQSAEFVASFRKECLELMQEFESKNIGTNLDIILLLLPIPSKDELNKAFDTRLNNARNI